VTEEAPWLPITLPGNDLVVDDVLGTWNTETTTDGLYEIRLAIYTAGMEPTYFVVSPLRIENHPPEFVVIGETATPTVPPRPTLAPSPTALDTTPIVTATTNANVRSGDGVGFPAIGSLLNGQTARIIGISDRGTGWFYIEMSDGAGMDFTSVVNAFGVSVPGSSARQRRRLRLAIPPAPTPRP
jgi:hypothetical protein